MAALLVGAALGAGITAGTALLLYTGQGFLRTAGFLLAITLAALAAGVWVGGGERAGRTTGSRWILLILAWSLAGAFAGLWLGAEAFRASMLGGALAVLLVLAEPAYLSGSLLVALEARAPGGAAPASIAGAAAGVLFASAFFIPRFDAPIVFLAIAVVLAFAGSAEVRVAPDSIAEEEPMDMQDRVALVTGVGHAGQVGYVIARRFLEAGARVMISDRAGQSTVLARELGPPDRVAGVAADLTSGEDVERMFATLHERFGRLDALVNVAGGLSVIKSVEDTTQEDWRNEIRRNAETVFLVSRAALPLLRAARGAIVNFASPAVGTRAARNLAAYGAAKAAVVSLTHALAVEERDGGVRVNAIAPGMIDTEQNRASVENVERVRWITREQIADVALFLASPAGAGVNGEVVHVLGDGVS